MNLDHYRVLAELFRYPDPKLPKHVLAAQTLLDDRYPEAGSILRPFCGFVTTAPPSFQEELYTRSFDVQAITTLDLGYVLFGDDYKRGAVLVHLSEEHRTAGNDCGNELADHLPNVLRLLPLMQDSELRDELASEILGRALRKIVAEFEPEHVETKRRVYEKHHKTWIDRSEEYGTIYRAPLEALYRVLEADFDLTVQAAPAQSSDFLRNIGTEITLEAQ